MLLVISFVALSLVFISYKLYKKFKVQYEFQNYNKVSPLAHIYSIIKGEPFDVQYNKVIRPVLEKEGETIILEDGSWRIVISDYERANFVLNNPNKFLKSNPDSPPDPERMGMKTFGENSILLSNGSEWRRHRNVMNPAFKKAHSVELLAGCGHNLIEKILSSNQEPVMAHGLFLQVALDLLGLGLFNKDFGALTQEGGSKITIMCDEVLKAVYNPLYLIFPVLEHLLPARKIDIEKGQEFRAFLRSLVQDRKEDIKNGKGGDDLLSRIIVASISEETNGGQLTEEEVVNDLAIFFLAGHDTTANTLTSMFFYLCKNKNVQDKMREEVESIVGSGSDSVVVPCADQLKEMKYIDCVIKETTRLSSTVTNLYRYTSETTTLPNGIVIPQGGQIYIDLFGAHRDPVAFPNPEVFDPERFSGPQSEQENKIMAFGGGYRMCVGKSFSILTQKLILSMLVQKFDFQFGPNYTGMERPKISTMGFIHPVNLDIVFTPRF